MPKTHVMVDLETLGTTADAVILSIGAVKFDPNEMHIDEDYSFYTSVSIDSQPERRISESTLTWWMNQSKEALAVFKEEKMLLREALKEFNEWIRIDKNAEDMVLWSNGADFDIPIIIHAMTQLGMTPQWDYRNHRCFRTFRNLPVGPILDVVRIGTKHNALDDAIHQARVVQAIMFAFHEEAKK